MKKKKPSLQRRILMTCIAISIFAALTLSLVSYHLISGIIREKESAATQNKLENLAITLDQRINSVISFMDSFVSNSAVNAAMISEPWNYSTREAELISTLFKTAILSNDNIIDSIVVYTDKGKRYAGGNGSTLVVDEIKRRVAEIEAKEPIGLWYMQLEKMPVRHTDPDYGLSLYYVLRNTSRLDQIGIIYVIISPEQLMSALQVSSIDRRIILADDNMNIIYSTDGDSIGQPLSERLSNNILQSDGNFLFEDSNETLQFAVHTSTAINNWHLIEIIPYASMTAELEQYILYILIIFAVAMAFIVLFSISGTRHNIKPLHRLMDSMVAVQHGNYDVELPVDSSDEVGQLTQTYNLMINRIKQLIQDIYASEQKKREIEMLVLQTQINPHFLYNTLNSIHWMAVVHGLNSISDMVNSLVAILRYSLNKFSTYTTLKVEVDMLEPYLFIQNVRFSNGISFSSNVPKICERCQIPRLLLQPLVENAISHGLRPAGGNGHIHIECSEENNILRVDISDNGVGLPHDFPEFTSYEEIRQMFPTSSDEFSIGLENTFNRIQLNFGSDYGLCFRSESGKGTTVRVTLPITYPEEEE